MLAGVLGFIGIGFFALPAGIVGSGFVELAAEDRQRRKQLETQRRQQQQPAEGGDADGRTRSAEGDEGLEAALLRQLLRQAPRRVAQLAIALAEERLAAIGGEPPAGSVGVRVAGER